MRIHERGGFYVLDYTDGDGKRHRRRFHSREDAERAAKPSTESDFARIVRHYLTYIKANKRPETYKTAKYVLHSAIRGGLTSVTVDAVAAYLESRKTVVTDATRACDARYLRAALRMAEVDGLIAKAPKVRAPRVKRKAIFTLTEDQIRKLIDAADRFTRGPLAIAATCGLRASELRNLRVADVDLVARTLHVRSRGDWEPKTGEDRKIELSPAAVDGFASFPGLHALVAGRDQRKPLFPSPRGHVWNPTRLARHVARAWRKAGLPQEPFGRLHALRASLATRLLAPCEVGGCGASLVDTAAILGHASPIVTTAHYISPTTEARRLALSRLFNAGGREPRDEHRDVGV